MALWNILTYLCLLSQFVIVQDLRLNYVLITCFSQQKDNLIRYSKPV